MLNEAYTWVVTVSVGGSAAGGAVAGVIVDHPGGRALGVRLRRPVLSAPRWSRRCRPGPIARADQLAADRLRRAMAAETDSSSPARPTPQGY